MTNETAILLRSLKVLTAKVEPVQITWCWAENVSHHV